MRLVVLAVLLGAAQALPSQAAAKDLPDDVLLWRNLYSGMTKDEVRALYPTRKSYQSSDCPVDVRPIYRKDKLASVVIQGGLGTCFQSAVKALKRDHGEGKITKMSGSFGNGSFISISYFSRITWQVGQVKITAIPIGRMGWIGYTVKTNDKYW